MINVISSCQLNVEIGYVLKSSERLGQFEGPDVATGVKTGLL